MTVHWPTAELDPVRQLRVLAATLPGTAMVEHVLPVAFDDVWAFLSDLEHNVPAFDTVVRRVRILERDGERLRIRANGIPFDVELRRGWCWMQAPGGLYVVGMAARSEDEDGGSTSTRHGHLEGTLLPGGRALQPIIRRAVAGDVRGVRRLLLG